MNVVFCLEDAFSSIGFQIVIVNVNCDMFVINQKEITGTISGGKNK